MIDKSTDLLSSIITISVRTYFDNTKYILALALYHVIAKLPSVDIGLQSKTSRGKNTKFILALALYHVIA